MRILLIEDDPLFAQLLEHVLAPYSHEVIHVVSVASALGELTNREFDVAVLDLILPDSGDHEKTAHAIPKFKRVCPGLSVIVVTGYEPAREAREACMANGADVFLSKREWRVLSKELLTAVASVVVGMPPDGRTDTFNQHVAMLERLSKS